MITAKDVEDMASRFFNGYDFVVTDLTNRPYVSSGFELSILDDTPGDRDNFHTLFLSDTNDPSSLLSKMIVFAEGALTPV